ncbi:MAG: RNA polymerase sigma factor [Solirubrobacteraceae bacterium]
MSRGGRIACETGRIVVDGCSNRRYSSWPVRRGYKNYPGVPGDMAVALRANHQPHAGDEGELVAAVRRGDDRAFELLYSRYRARIGAYIQGMIGDPGRAEDIAQEVFISALRRLRATEQPILLKPWLYEIAKNACIDEFRRAHRAQEVPLETEGGLDQIGTLHAINVTPDAAIETKQRLNDLRGAFHGLSDHHHQILVLRELEGLSYNQIGARMGISKPVVESTLFRARRRLGEEFAELESGRRCARVQGMIAAVASGSRPERSLGLRERRLLGRHLSHCDQCVRDARLAGIDDVQLRGLRKAAKAGGVAAVSLPWWLRLRGATPSEHAASTAQKVQSALPAASSIDQLSGLGRAATAAVLAIAGVGGIVASRAVINSGSPTPIVWTLGAVHGFHGVGVLGGSGVVPQPAASNVPGTRGGVGANGSGAWLAGGLLAPALGKAAVTLTAPGSGANSPATVGSAAGQVSSRPANLAGGLLAGGVGHGTGGGLPIGGVGAAGATRTVNSPVSSVPRAGAAPAITVPHVGANLPITHGSPGTISIGPIKIGVGTASAGGGTGVGATGPVIPRIPGAPGSGSSTGAGSGSSSGSPSGTSAAGPKAGATVNGAAGAATGSAAQAGTAVGAATGSAAQTGTAVGAATGSAAQAGTAVGAATGPAAQAGGAASSATSAATAAGVHPTSSALSTGT